MNKFVCFLSVFTALILMMSTAFAAELTASYSDGMLTVSTSSEGYYRIVVDGTGTGYAVSHRSPTYTFAWPLQPGEHTVTITDEYYGTGKTTIIVPGNAAEPVDTEDKTGNDKADESEGTNSQSGVHEHSFEVLPATEPTCMEKGKSEGYQCTDCGLVMQDTFPAQGHRYKIVSHNDTTNFFECVRCGNKIQAGLKDAVQNRYGNILVDGNGEALIYQAVPGNLIMTLALDEETSQFTLTMDISLIMQFMREGNNQVEIVNGKTVTAIDLYQISPSWFNTTEKVEKYIITIGGEPQVTVETLINGEKLAAETFAGITIE